MSWRGWGVFCRSVRSGLFVRRKSRHSHDAKSSATALRHMIAFPSVRPHCLLHQWSNSLPILFVQTSVCPTPTANNECSSLAACTWPSTHAFSSLSFVRFLSGLAPFRSVLCLLTCPPSCPPALMPASGPLSPTAFLPPLATIRQISAAFAPAKARLVSPLEKVLYVASPPNVERIRPPSVRLIRCTKSAREFPRQSR